MKLYLSTSEDGEVEQPTIRPKVNPHCWPVVICVKVENGRVAVEDEKESVRPLEHGFGIYPSGEASSISVNSPDHYSAFPTREAAQAHAKRQRVFNAIGRACALVDPDGCDGDYSPYKSIDGQWKPSSIREREPYLPRVSTREAAERVCEVLTEWGV